MFTLVNATSQQKAVNNIGSAHITTDYSLFKENNYAFKIKNVKKNVIQTNYWILFKLNPVLIHFKYLIINGNYTENN